MTTTTKTKNYGTDVEILEDINDVAFYLQKKMENPEIQFELTRNDYDQWTVDLTIWICDDMGWECSRKLAAGLNSVDGNQRLIRDASVGWAPPAGACVIFVDDSRGISLAMTDDFSK